MKMEQWETRDLIEVKNDWKRLAQEQAEKIEELMKWNDELQAELIEKDEKIEELERSLNKERNAIEWLVKKIEKREDLLIEADADKLVYLTQIGGLEEKIDHLKEVIKKYDVALDNEKNSQTEK
jgi:chromosome segregation ATPase